MKITIQMIIDDGNKKIKEDVACLERQGLSAETLGLSLEESKVITSGIQKAMTAYQVSNYTHKQRPCLCCGKLRPIKEYKPLVHQITSFAPLN